MLVIQHCRRFLLDAMQWTATFVSVTFIATLIRFICMLLVCENKNNGGKYYHRKFMQAANEKLIITQ